MAVAQAPQSIPVQYLTGKEQLERNLKKKAATRE